MAEYTILTQWKSLLLRGPCTIQIIEELQSIADLATKKSFDIQLAIGLPSGGGWSDFYAHILHWLVEKVGAKYLLVFGVTDVYQKLQESHPTLYNSYCSLFDKTILSYLNSK